MKFNNPFLLLIFLAQIALGQTLTLSDLENICDKTNWESVNQFLMNKNWEYYESAKGDSEKYNTITWSFNKSFGDKAEAWFYLFTYEGFPNKISYSVFNKPSYTVIQNYLSSKGYKLQNSEIEDNELISTYANSKFLLKITTQKREKDNYSSMDESITAYKFLLIKKASIYDTDNGKKIDYYNDKVKQAEYTMLNGKMNGLFKVYYENGKLKKAGNYLNGLASGDFKEYDENGSLQFEYTQKNDQKNGKLISYENNKVSYTTHYKNDMENGERIEYYYEEETGRLNLKVIGEYLDDEKNGVWKVIYIDKEKEEKTLTSTRYSKGLKDGFSQEIKGDSLILANYSNDKLNGKYEVYLDLSKKLFGGVIETDPSKLFLVSEGNYSNDKKTDYWKNYSLSRDLTSEGSYLNDTKSGEWKYYYLKYIDEDNEKSLPYSGELYLIENYSNGKLNGSSTRYSYLNEEEYPCLETDNENPLDKCKRFVYQKVYETTFYKNDNLNGPFEVRDSTNSIISKGFFKDDLHHGEWLHRYSDKDINDEEYFVYQKGNYINDEREGKWIQYYTEGKITETFNYKNGKLDGEYVVWNKFNRPREKKQFDGGNLKEVITFDSLGLKPVNKYEIYNENTNNYKCRQTQYLDEGYVSQEFWIKKEDDINNSYFELLFGLLVGKLSDGTRGYKDGEYKLYNSNNQPIVLGNFYKEDRIGLWSFYYYDQNVKIDSNFSGEKHLDEKYFNLNGEPYSGDFEYFDRNKGVKEERKIKDGLRNGKTTYIDTKTNKTIKKESYKNGELN